MKAKRGESSLSVELNDVAFGFVQTYFQVESCVEPLAKLLPDNDGDVFGGWIQCLKFFRIAVQIAVVERFHDFFVDQRFQFFQVEHEPGFGIDLPVDQHFELVVVPVKIGVGTKPEHVAVFIVAPVAAEQAVRGVELRFADDGGFHGVKLVEN